MYQDAEVGVLLVLVTEQLVWTPAVVVMLTSISEREVWIMFLLANRSFITHRCICHEAQENFPYCAFLIFHFIIYDL